MKKAQSFIKGFIVLVITMTLMSGGCGGDKKVNVGYYYIEIPAWEIADYQQMLSSKNPEEQYNALAYLSFRYDDADVLKYDSMKGTGRYDTALMIYNKAVELTASENSWVSSAAFHLLGVFEYEKAFAVYRTQLLKNRNSSLNVQMEIYEQLKGDSITDYSLLKVKINFLSQQPSWLLKKSAYHLMKRGDSLIMNDVMKKYNAAANDVDKFLLLEALTHNINDAVFVFLVRVWDTAKDERLKTMITQNLPSATNKQKIVEWYGQHPEQLKKQMTDFVANTNAVYSQMILLAIQKGWNPHDVLFGSEDSRFNNLPALYCILLMDKYDNDIHPDSILIKQSNNSKLVEMALLQHPVWRNEWLTFERKYKPLLLSPELIAAHRKLTETYLHQTRLLMLQHGIDTLYYAELLKSIIDNTDLFYKKRLELQ
jgi:hypothetical protein